MVATETRETGEPRRTPWLFLAAAGRMEPASTATETPGDSRVGGKRRRVGLGAGEAGRLFGHVWFCRRGDWTQDAEIRESDVRSKYESGNRHCKWYLNPDGTTSAETRRPGTDSRSRHQGREAGGDREGGREGAASTSRGATCLKHRRPSRVSAPRLGVTLSF